MSVNVELEATYIKCDNGNDNDSTEWKRLTQMQKWKRKRLAQDASAEM